MSTFKEAIQSGLEEYLQDLHRALEGLTPAEVRWQPTLHTNHIAWLVWHMARVEDRWVSRLRQRPEVWTADGWADRFHMNPTSGGNGQTMEEVRAMPAIPLTDLMGYFEAVRAVTRQYLEALDLLRTEHGGETVRALRANECEGVPIAFEDGWIEEADATGAEAHGGGGEAVDVFAVQEVVLQLLFRNPVGGFVVELGQQVDFPDRGCLRPFALAAEVESRKHLLT
jgi:hypothetical protein